MIDNFIISGLVFFFLILEILETRTVNNVCNINIKADNTTVECFEAQIGSS